MPDVADRVGCGVLVPCVAVRVGLGVLVPSVAARVGFGVLVPGAAAQALARLNSQQTVQIIAGAAHAVHWGLPELVVQVIQDYIQPVALDKKQIAHSFSRAAATYDSVANLQRKVGEVLLQKLAPNPTAQVVLDLGCGIFVRLVVKSVNFCEEVDVR